MLDAFETRLTDLLADALVGTPNLGPIGRSGAVAAPAAGNVGIAIRVAGASSTGQVGDDERERLGPRGAIRLRPLLHLEGDAVLRLEVATPRPADAAEVRQRLVTVMDAVLLALHREPVRNGREFLTNVDQGFELDGFRLAALGAAPEQSDDPRTFELTYHFAGRFWPVEEPAEGGLIVNLPTRLTVMPVRLPERISARAGGGDVQVPIHIDLRATNGAPSLLAARLAGAAPPGALVGDPAAAVPDGFTGFPQSDGGIFRLVYRPPETLSARTEVRVQTRLAHADRPTISLTEFAIEVLPS